jgi:hypothetical protein
MRLTEFIKAHPWEAVTIAMGLFAAYVQWQGTKKIGKALEGRKR